MGNTPTKETRSNASSFGGPGSLSRDILIGGTEPTVGSAGITRKKREKEKERLRRKEEHVCNLIVRYGENVDGGFLAPYSNYKYTLSYKTQVVRDLIIERRLAPFYTPLESYDEDWTDGQLLKQLKKLSLHIPCTSIELQDDEEDPDEHKIYQSVNSLRRKDNKLFKKKLKIRALQLQNEADERYVRDKKTQGSGIRTFADIPSDDLLLKLYRGAQECPICFLYYPKNMNLTRCCVQPICTECFVQMKRLEPHIPHDESGGHHDDERETEVDANPGSEGDSDDLISEPVKCPFCAMPEFGVIYSAPDFKTGIGGTPPSEYRDSSKPIEEEKDEDSSSTKIASSLHDSTKPSRILSVYKGDAQHSRSFSSASQRQSENGTPVKKRRGSLPPTAPGVISIDDIQPDWEQRLLNARSKSARRSAAATALHASSLIVEDSRHSNISNQERSSSVSNRAGDYRGGFSKARSRTLSRQEQVEIEQKMVEEALRLSLLDEEERKLKQKVQQKEQERETEHNKIQTDLEVQRRASSSSPR
ncbi:hypothetical protein FOA43_000721 [Brettanomyces nanus]|uniref:C2H2-type domain-containing protein n=1 Tax=Eeniella nana TaxID=13502 RepID=A0A875RW71_EENNA|nr:uncharacterized protein FOA43_000721 [Brettanomyces nanus]QPG73411.1 hypothetical protein FOA43_000721 [Brettanomyces nanus]